MVKKKGKRQRKALEKAKRQKGLKDIPTDTFTKLLYVGQQLKELAEEQGVDYVSITEDDERLASGKNIGPIIETDEEMKERIKRQRG